MDKALQDKMTQYISTLEEAIKTGSEFITEQTPLVIQELLYRERATTSIGLVAGILSFVIAMSLLKKLKSVNDNDPIAGVSYFIGIIVLFALSFVLFVENSYSFITCWLTPRVFILEELHKFIR